jgi:endoglucanase Acf2
MGQHQAQEDVSLTARARPQYHYFYGSTENGVEATDGGTEEEQGSLIGEGLVMTDNDEETTRTSEHDLPHLVITKGWCKSEAQPTSVGPTSVGVRRTFVIIALALAMSTFLVVLFPHTSQPLPPAQTAFMPFLSVERADYGDPVEGFIDLDLFHPNLLSDDSDSRTFVFPFPTGAFWTNLVVPPPAGEISYPVAVYPYAYKWSETVLQASYPASHRLTDRLSIRDAFVPELTFSTRETVQGRAVTRFDPLSVSLRFSTGSGKNWESTLVQGSPYITIRYVKATPVLKALSIFKSVQCPGDDDENFSDLNTDDEIHDEQRRLFGVCSMDVSAWRISGAFRDGIQQN